MRRILIAIIFLSGTAIAQRIIPSQIQPGVAGQCLVTVGTTTTWATCPGGGGGGGGGYNTIQSAGVALAQQATLNFLGALSCVNDGANSRTNCQLTTPITVSQGGTGLATLAVHQLYVGNGTAVPNAVATGNAGQVLISGGAGADPAFADPVVSQPTASLLNATVVQGTGTNLHTVVDSGNIGLSGVQTSPLATWTSATAQNTVVTPVNNNFGFGTCSFSFVQTTTITGGAAAFETSVDGNNWFTIGAIDAVSGIPVPSNIYTFQANTNKLFQVDETGYSFQRIRLSTAITGTGTVTIASTCQSASSPSLTTVYQAPGNWLTQDAADMTGTVPGTAPGFTHITGGIFNSSAPVPTNGQTLPLQLNASGALKIDGSGVTQPVSGTVTTTPPANASTNVTQIAGNAVSTAASGTQKIGVTGNTGAAMDAAGQNAASPANELVVAGQFNTAPTTITSGNVSPLQLDNAGNLLVNVKAGGASGGTSSSFAAAFPATGTAIGVKNGANMVNLTADGSGNLDINCTTGCGISGDQSTGSTALGALNAVITVPLAGESGVAFQLQSGGTGIYTVTPQCSYDGGTIYNTNGYIQDPFTGVITTAATIASAQATTDYPVLCPSGASNAQMKVTAYTSGTANWLARSTVMVWPPMVWGIVTTNAPSYTVGQINAISLDANGLLRTSLKDTPSNTNNFNTNLAALGGTSLSGAQVVDVANAAFKVNCVTGCGAASTFTDNTAFTAGTTSENNIGGVFNDGLTAITSGNAAAARITNNRALHINIRNAAGTEIATSGNPLRIDPTGTTTQPVSGTVTANIGTTNGLALDTSVNGILNSQGSTTSGEKGPLDQGAVTTNAPSYTTGQTSPISLDTSGLLRASLKDTPSNTNNLNVNLAASGIVVSNSPPANQTVNVTQFGGNNILTGTGASGVGVPRVTVANDSSIIATQASGANLHVNCDSGCAGASASATFISGQVTVSTTPTALPSNITKNVCITAASANGERVYLGGSNVSPTTGDELSPGVQKCYPVNNSNLIFLVGLSTGESVTWAGTN